MSAGDPGAETRTSALIDRRPLTERPAFARLWLGNTLAGLGAQMTVMAVMLGNRCHRGASRTLR